MTWANERMRAALREIESGAATALANQPNNTDECGRHLNKALAVIELKAHVARWGQEGYPRRATPSELHTPPPGAVMRKPGKFHTTNEEADKHG